jgi:hypothetical protein
MRDRYLVLEPSDLLRQLLVLSHLIVVVSANISPELGCEDSTYLEPFVLVSLPSPDSLDPLTLEASAMILFTSELISDPARCKGD